MPEGHRLPLLTRTCGAGHNFVKIVILVFGKINVAFEKASLLTLWRVEAFKSLVALNRRTITTDRCCES